jgi:excisionase family DNA binding protein
MNRCRTISRRPDPPPDHRYFRIAEAADYLGGTVWFMYTLTWKKAIPFTKIGKRIVFDRVDLDAYMQNMKLAVV